MHKLLLLTKRLLKQQQLRVRSIWLTLQKLLMQLPPSWLKLQHFTVLQKHSPKLPKRQLNKQTPLQLLLAYLPAMLCNCVMKPKDSMMRLPLWLWMLHR